MAQVRAHRGAPSALFMGGRGRRSPGPLPEWKSLSPLPSPKESAAALAMETDSSSVEREYRLLLL